MHKMSLRSASDSPAQVMGKVMLLVQLGDLHVRVPFNMVDSLAVPLFVVTQFIGRLVNRIFSMELHSPRNISPSADYFRTHASIGSVSYFTD